MKIEYVANSGSIYHLSNGKTLLVDPWIVSECNQTWFVFPPVPEPEQEKIFQRHYDYLYISHLHADHLHPPTLARLDRDIHIIIGKLDTPHLKQRLNGLGFRNISECEPEQRVRFDGFEVAVFTDFHKSSLDHAADLDYDLDTSFYLWDDDGSRVFNNIDNSLLPEDATRIRDEFGQPHVAFLSYASASLFPMAMLDYSPDKKLALSAELKRKFAGIFHRNARNIGADRVIPAGGEYVLGARSAAAARFMPATQPAELMELGGDEAIAQETFCKLYQGDVLAVPDYRVTLNRDATYRNCSWGDVVGYAESLADRPCGYESMRLPAEIELSWPRLLRKAAANFERAVSRREIRIPQALVLEAYPSEEMRPGSFWFVFNEADQKPRFCAEPPKLDGDHVRFRLDQKLLLQILIGALNWNNLESSALIGVSRTPDEYRPDVHNCMTFFSL